MTNTQIAEYIGQPNLGYVLVALPSGNMQRQITDLLDKLSRQLPGIIWPMPSQQLHLTLCEIIQPKDYSQDKEALYKLHQAQYENTLSQILADTSKFTVTLNTIEASPQAIIVRASDSSTFNSIRAKLVANIQLPRQTRTPPDITHSSIARYLQEVDLDKVQRVIARHSIVIEEEIAQFKLLKTLIPPLQEYQVLETYPLAAS